MENGSFFCQYSLAITICRENASLYYRATSLYMTTKIVWPSRTTAGVLREKKRGKHFLEIIITAIKLHDINFLNKHLKFYILMVDIFRINQMPYIGIVCREQYKSWNFFDIKKFENDFLESEIKPKTITMHCSEC